MTQETIIDANKISQNEFANHSASEDSVFIKTVRLTLNLLTNIFLVITVFVCLLYAWTSSKLNVFQLHIVLCVLGYQFFMTQGTLVLSKYNSWSMFLPRRYKRHLHWVLQLVGIVLVTIGSSVMIEEKYVNFDTAHGITGLCALITSLIGFFNGLLAMHAYKLSSYINAYWIKFIHYATGIGTLLLSAACLCLGFEKVAFKSWSGTDDAIVLMIFTCFFTMCVAMDFWIATGRKIRNTI